jgi:hypothetical protein
MKRGGELWRFAKLRQVKFLNNIVEQDHRRIKRLVRPGLGFKSFVSASRRFCQLDAEEAKLPRAQPSRQYTSAHEDNTSRIAPGKEGAITGGPVLTGRETMTAELEVVVDPSVSGEELLCMPG